MYFNHLAVQTPANSGSRAKKLAWLIRESLTRNLTGVELKDESAMGQLETLPTSHSAL